MVELEDIRPKDIYFYVVIKDNKYLNIKQITIKSICNGKILSKDNEQIDNNYCFQYQDDAKLFAFNFVRKKLVFNIQ